MESRSRRFPNPSSALDEAALASSAWTEYSNGKGSRPRGAGARLARLFALIVCGGFALQWWLWKPLPTDVEIADASPLQSNRLRGNNERYEHGIGTGADAEAPTIGRVNDDAAPAFPPLVVTAQSAEDILARRKRYNPASHSKDQKEVVEMVKWAWGGYAKHAYGRDSLNIHDRTGPSQDLALTLVDSLDTLFLVGMFEEFDEASGWVAKNLETRMHYDGWVSVFETTIRVMGGLLSSFYLSGHEHLLVAAKKLGDLLTPAFKEYNHGFPDKDYNIVKKITREAPSLAEVGSLQLEFKYLARLTGKTEYQDQVEHIMDSLARDVAEKYPNGLLPVVVNQRTGRISGGKVTLGANGDSYYEYLLKQWLLSGKRETKYKNQYIVAVNGIMDQLVAKSKPSGLVFIGELVDGHLSPKMDHLVCFVPGMLALGYMHGMPESHLKLAEQLLETCYQMYAQMDAKLAPEIAYFNMNDDASKDLDIHPRDAFNLLRPETVESLMIMYRVTKNEKYRVYGREIMRAFEKHCKLETGGYMSIGNVAKGPVQTKFRDGMESFFVAETLKYLFLLFSDDSVFPLDQIVFNTEAHPFPMEQPVLAD
uniref:alpha-1,2-Mannosidase n=1 Tax=Globisporangium ultimum (strain ATCC 200006 / CBS 805.95 / DAOM BR144) TaxID=431595 RepID=K3WLS3_GLOUD